MRKNSLAVSCFKYKTQEMEISLSESLASWMFRLKVNEREPLLIERRPVLLVFPPLFHCCLSSFLPSRCSVHGADVCPGCWMKTSTSSPSLNSLVMCMLLQLTSSLFVFLCFCSLHCHLFATTQSLTSLPVPCCHVSIHLRFYF